MIKNLPLWKSIYDALNMPMYATICPGWDGMNCRTSTMSKSLCERSTKRKCIHAAHIGRWQTSGKIFFESAQAGSAHFREECPGKMVAYMAIYNGIYDGNPTIAMNGC